MILAFFGQGYRISLQDMQLVSDACPLRIDSMFVRSMQDGDQILTNLVPSFPAAPEPNQVCAVLSICVLDSNQPVRITEAEVVRVRKRSRGLLLSSMFGDS